MISLPVDLYTDGSCSPNPGPGGYAYIIVYRDENDSGFPETKEIEHCQGYKLTTNNRMEIIGVIEGIKDVLQRKISDPNWSGVVQLNIYSDSEYTCKAINQRWINRWAENNWMTAPFKGKQPGPVKNRDLWEQVINLQKDLSNNGINMVITHVDGHSGHEYNERCDKLAVGATHDPTSHIIDEVFEKNNTVVKWR